MTDETPKNGFFTDFYMSDTSQMKLKGEYKDEFEHQCFELGAAMACALDEGII